MEKLHGVDTICVLVAYFSNQTGFLVPHEVSRGLESRPPTTHDTS